MRAVLVTILIVLISASFVATATNRLLITRGNNIRGELMVTLPISMFLPTLLVNEEDDEADGKTDEDDDDDDALRSKSDQNSLDYLMDRLRIDSIQCRQKFICQIAENPNRFLPLSDFVYLYFKRKKQNSIDRKFYYNSFLIGRNKNKPCSESYQCHRDKMVNLEMLKFWQKLSQRIPLKISTNL